jgi:hypothetical protein
MPLAARLLTARSTTEPYDPLRALAQRVVVQALLDHVRGRYVSLDGLHPWACLARIQPAKLREAFGRPADEMRQTVEGVRTAYR